MTFSLQELSIFGGRPVELYRFEYGSSIQRFTSSDRDVMLGGVTYEDVPIRRGRIERNQDIGRTPVTINIARNNFTDLFISSPPTDTISVTISRYHETDTDQQVVVLWIGRIVDIKYNNLEVEFRCEPVDSSLKRPALRRFYQTNCPHILYELDCKAPILNFRTQGTVTNYDNAVVTAAEIGPLGDGYFTGGVITFTELGTTGRRFILSHTGSSVTLNLPTTALPVGASFDIFPGCDHTLSTCLNKFNNILNYGGYPYIPDKNPFGASPVF